MNTQTNEIKGIIVFHVDVGSLPPFKAEALIENIKEQINKNGLIDQLKKQQYEIILFPVRPNSLTRVEMIPVKPGCIPVINETIVIDEGEIKRKKKTIRVKQ